MHRTFSAIVLFLLASAVAAYADVSVLVIAIGNPDNPSLSKVIGTAAVVQLKRAGLVASSESGTTSPSASPGSLSGSNAAADFVLVISYTHSGGQVSLELSFRETRTGKTVATDAATFPFDLNLDVNVSSTVDTLITKPEVERAIKITGERQPKASPRHVAAKSATTSAAPAPPNKTPRPETSSAARQVPSQPRPQPERIGWRYVVDLHGAPMLLVGDSSNYFRYGVDVSIFNAVQLPIQKLSVEVGLLTGASQLFSVFGTGEGKVYAFGVGPQINIGSDPHAAANVGIVASGGAAFILAQPTGMALEAKTDFYAAGGISANLKLFRSIVIGMEMKARVVFEERYPIVAVIPALTIGF